MGGRYPVLFIRQRPSTLLDSTSNIPQWINSRHRFRRIPDVLFIAGDYYVTRSRLQWPLKEGTPENTTRIKNSQSQRLPLYYKE